MSIGDVETVIVQRLPGHRYDPAAFRSGVLCGAVKRFRCNPCLDTANRAFGRIAMLLDVGRGIMTPGECRRSDPGAERPCQGLLHLDGQPNIAELEPLQTKPVLKATKDPVLGHLDLNWGGVTGFPPVLLDGGRAATGRPGGPPGHAKLVLTDSGR